MSGEGNPLAFVPSPTPFLERIVAHLRSRLAPAEFASLLAGIEALHRAHEAALRAAPPGAERARLLHRLMDQELEAAAHAPVSCRKGCSGCCHYEVQITGDEAALLKEAVEDGIEIDRERLARLAARKERDPEWAQFAVPENRCVFLSDEGACRVYAARPASCRKHLVTSPAALCSLPGQEVIPVPLLQAEVLMSAALGLEGTKCASLSRMLREASRKS